MFSVTRPDLGTVDHKGFGEAEEKSQSTFQDLSRKLCPLSSGPDICYSCPFKDEKIPQRKATVISPSQKTETKTQETQRIRGTDGESGTSDGTQDGM